MKPVFKWAVGVIAVASLAACAQRNEETLPPVSQYSSPALPELSPPDCKGQKNTKTYAYDTETLSTKGGSLCDPVFDGTGGMLPYAPANPSISVMLTTSTTNYNHKLPKLGKGMAIAYEQFALSKGTTFGKGAKGDASVFSARIAPGKTYTLYAQFVVNGSKKNGKPCYATATKGKYGGDLDLGASPLQGTSIQPNTTIIGEIYPGKQAAQRCS